MKKMMTLLALTISVGAFAQDTKVLDSSDVSVRTPNATLIRTSQTPNKVEIMFNNIPMTSYECVESRNIEVRYQCGQTAPVVIGTRREPFCIQYYPNTNRCRTMGTRQVPVTRTETRYCTRYETQCLRHADIVRMGSDKVKIKFKGLPNLGGTEQETFEVVASQNGRDSLNVVYSIRPIQTINNAAYAVEKKGILGYDSYVIEPK
jgi:hypothetical protein